MRIGQGIDVHRFSEDPHRPLVLGGVVIEGARGLGGHSDADAVCHALADAVLGAVGLGDLGRHFPDTDPVWEGADSVALLTEVVRMAAGEGYRCANADCTVVADTPRLAPHTPAMVERLGPCWGRPSRSRRPGPRVSVRWAGPRASPAWPSSCWSRCEPLAQARPAPGTARAGPIRVAAPRPEGLSELGGDQVEGRRAVLELLSVGRRPVRRILLAEDQDPSPQLDRIEELAARMRIPVETVPRARLDTQARTESPQGVVALAAPVEPVPLEDLCAPSGRRRNPSCWSPPGSPTRATWAPCCAAPSAPGSPVSSCPRHRSARLSPTVAKTAAGALEHLRFAAVGGIPAALATLRELGVWSIGLAGEAEQSLYALPLGDGPVALVVGSEEKGLPPLVRKRCDAVAAIPQHGALPSLNVGVAGAVACFEVARQRSRGRRLTYAAGVTSEVQKAQRWAATGMSLRHWGHSRVSGSGSSLGRRFRRFISMLSGTTTAKKTTVATMRKDSSALMNAP